MTIQQLVISEALRYPPSVQWHSNWLGMAVYNRCGVALTYKQRRDALYRLRERYSIRHISRGFYIFDIK